MDKVKNDKTTKRMSVFGWILFSVFLLVSAAFGVLVGTKYISGNTSSVNYDGLVYYYDNGIVGAENEYSRNKIEKVGTDTYMVKAYDTRLGGAFCDNNLTFNKQPSPVQEAGLLEYYYCFDSVNNIRGELFIYQSKLKLQLEDHYFDKNLEQEYTYLQSGNLLLSYSPDPFELEIKNDNIAELNVSKDNQTYSYSIDLSKKNSNGECELDDGSTHIKFLLTETSLRFSVTSPFAVMMYALSPAVFFISLVGTIAIFLIQLIAIAVKKDYKIRKMSLVVGWIGFAFSIVSLGISVAAPFSFGSDLKISAIDFLAYLFPLLSLLLVVLSLVYIIDTSKKGKPIKEARKAYLVELHNQQEKERLELREKKLELREKKAVEKKELEEKRLEEKRIEDERRSSERAKLEAERKETQLAYEQQKEETRVANENKKNAKIAQKEEALKKSFALRPLYFGAPLLILAIFSFYFIYYPISIGNGNYSSGIIIFALVSLLLVGMCITTIIGLFPTKKKEKYLFIYSILSFIFLFSFVFATGRGRELSFEGFYGALSLIELVAAPALLVALLITHFLIKKDKSRIITNLSLLVSGFLLVFALRGILEIISLFATFSGPFGSLSPDEMAVKREITLIVELVLLVFVLASFYFVYLSIIRPLSEKELDSIERAKQRKAAIEEEKRLEKEYDLLNKQFNIAIKNKDYEKAKELENKIKAYEKEHGLEKASYFDGGLLSLFGWKLLGYFLTAITFGIAYPWSVCFIKRWEVKHSVIGANRLIFTGTGGKLFVKYIVWWLLSIVTLGIFLLFLPIKMEKWVASHTFDAPLDKVEHVKRLEEDVNHATTNHNVDEVERLSKELDQYKKDNDILGESYFDGKLLQLIGWNILCFLVNLITLTIAKPFTTCWKMKWKTKHQVILGRRLCFDGNGLQLIGRYILWLILTVITLGIYGLWLGIKMKKWETKHIHYEKAE